jgi:molecular chaperone IbpA
MSDLITKNDQLMRDFFSHSIGLDGLFDRLINFKQVKPSFPPYNIIRDGNKTFIEVALAGYSKEDIDIIVEDGVLSIRGTGYSERQGIGECHRGIASRRFTKSFSLGEYVEVSSAELKDGMLTVELEEVLPPEKQPKTIEIN